MIFEYEKLGKYGPERQLAALERQKQLDSTTKQKTKKKAVLADYLKELGLEL